MSEISNYLEERYSEVEAYLDLIKGIETAIQSGVPKIGKNGPVVSVDQQKILHSTVYLQLYNVIEATVTKCLDEVSRSTMIRSNCKPSDLNEDLLREWLRTTARTQIPLNSDNRLKDAIEMFDRVKNANPVQEFKIERGGGGNWNDKTIEKIVARIGCTLNIKRSVKTGIKRKIRDDRGSMELIVDLRNKLAHGSISFVECGGYDTAAELKELAARVISYLRELVKSIDHYVQTHQYLHVQARPLAVNAT